MKETLDKFRTDIREYLSVHESLSGLDEHFICSDEIQDWPEIVFITEDNSSNFDTYVYDDENDEYFGASYIKEELKRSDYTLVGVDIANDAIIIHTTGVDQPVYEVWIKWDLKNECYYVYDYFTVEELSDAIDEGQLLKLLQI